MNKGHALLVGQVTLLSGSPIQATLIKCQKHRDCGEGCSCSLNGRSLTSGESIDGEPPQDCRPWPHPSPTPGAFLNLPQDCLAMAHPSTRRAFSACPSITQRTGAEPEELPAAPVSPSEPETAPGLPRPWPHPSSPKSLPAAPESPSDEDDFAIDPEGGDDLVWTKVVMTLVWTKAVMTFEG